MSLYTLFVAAGWVCALGGTVGVVREMLDARSRICSNCDGAGTVTTGDGWSAWIVTDTCPICHGYQYAARSRPLVLVFGAVSLIGWWAVTVWLVTP